MTRPDVSVIMPFHNAERWIGDAVRSINRTSGLRAELIAIDDASTDASADIVTKISTFPVKIVRNSINCGTATSLNAGLNCATGRYIARMDADDVCMPDRFRRQIAYIHETGCDLCGAWIKEFGRGVSRRLTYPVGADAVDAALLFQEPVCHPTIMARREVFDAFRYCEDFKVAQDYDLLSRVSQRFRIDNVPAVLLRYRRHKGQTTLAKRELVASMATKIRTENLRRRGIATTSDELRLHNLIRCPRSIETIVDLQGIESWLVRLRDHYPSSAARHIVARQWVYACVRAAPLGHLMWQVYTGSPLRKAATPTRGTDTNLFLLSKLRLRYESALFDRLARLRIGL